MVPASTIIIFTDIRSAINECSFRRYLLLDCFHKRSGRRTGQVVARSAKPSVIYTTEEVLSEYLNYFAGWGEYFRHRAGVNVQDMQTNRNVRIAAQTPESFRAGFELYRARLDKGYSLTDCISMRIMRRERIEDVLTNDAHFEQEGFVRF